MEWLERSWRERGGWVKVNRRVVLDMGGVESGARREFLRFVVGRFMIGARQRQYICISNSVSGE